MKRAWIVVVCTVLAVLMTASSAAADAFDPHSPEELRDHGWAEHTADLKNRLGWETGEQATIFCKTPTEVTEDDEASLPVNDTVVQEKIDEFIQHYKEVFAGTEHEQDDDSDYAMLCVSPELADGPFFCVTRNRNLPEDTGLLGRSKDLESECWSSTGEEQQSLLDEATDAVADPVGTLVDNQIEVFGVTLAQGVRWFFAALLYWWIAQHPELEESSASVLWPVMLGLGMFVGTLLLIGQGIRLMVSRQPGIIVSTLKGLGVFTATCVAGVAVLISFSHFTDWLSVFFLTEGMKYDGCSQYQADQAQPDGLVLDFPEANNSDNAELGKAFGHCVAATLHVTFGFSGLIIVLYILAFIMSFVQGALLFVHEAALPIMLLLLPIAAAGQIGSTNSKRWLPGLLSLVATVLLYKPMVALVFAVGFTQASLSNDAIDIMRGLVTLFVGVIAPGVMMRSFKPLMTTAVENGASLGSVANNALLISQLGGTVSHWMQKRAGERAAQAARKAAATHAAHQGAGQLAMTATKAAGQAASTAAGAAGGPVGWAATAAKWLKSLVSFGARGGKGMESAAQAAAGHPPHPGASHAPGGTSPQGQPGLHVRQPGQPSSHPPQPHPTAGPAGEGGGPRLPDAPPPTPPPGAQHAPFDDGASPAPSPPPPAPPPEVGDHRTPPPTLNPPPGIDPLD
ncbi:hypothetical protein NI17_024170 (plasmid) [Thermobifida halotolerans]|uniref:TrbL/VirB6 plasmid conjugal transfer protein n=2 Tax=Thermobifida halotolerans TaxID=483545 RepID=A0AA97M1Y1_9ACTN|nr:hypothetical protein [Thermobifida halotolerans]UOE22263.1 hypothetical protein NI17_024170 [Thermobifida halotolerans]